MKNYKNKKWLLLTILLFFTQIISAQLQVTVNGNIIDETNREPIIGASVMEKGTSKGVISDMDGYFSITVAQGATIRVSYIGFITQDIVVTGNGTLNVAMKDDITELSDVVVTGYATQKKADLTGAVSVVKVSEVKSLNTGNIIKALQGRIPGVFIKNSGRPDGNVDIKIRGASTLGNSNPMYVIDGIPTTRNLSEISMEDIESVQVLKDASSATIYGSRAANGVIIVTTKKGSQQGTNIQVNASLTAQQWQRGVRLLNSDEYAQVLWQANVNDKRIQPGNDVVVPGYTYKYNWHYNGEIPVLDNVTMPQYLYVNGEPTMLASDTDWIQECSQTGITQNYNITVSNVNNKSNSLFSADYYSNVGTLKGSYFNRINLRFNNRYSLINDRLTIGENLLLTKTRSLTVLGGQGDFALLRSIIPVHSIDGGWGGPSTDMSMSDRNNPVRVIDDNLQNYGDLFRLFGDVNLELKLLKGLNFRSKFGMDYTVWWKRNMQYSYVNGFRRDDNNRVTVDSNHAYTWTLNNVLEYDFDLGQNNFNILVGQESVNYRYDWVSASRESYLVESPDYMYLNSGEKNPQNSGSASEYALLSFFGKVNYNYADKYLASVTVRRDGSSRFGINNRWGTFPAFSLGWRISQENFFNNDFVSDLKLRYGWGQTGNQEIDNYASYGLYQSVYYTDPTWELDKGTAYDIYGTGSGTLPSGFIRTQRGNANLKWEATTQNNIGLDFGFLGQKITGSIDWFFKETSDILISPPWIATIGYGGNYWTNGATMQNRGLEFAAAYNTKIGQVDFSINGNIAGYRNKITKLPEDVINSYAGNGNDQTILGRPWHSLFGYVTDGLFQTQAEVDAHADQLGKDVGRIRYKDVNDDNEINDEDRTWLGVEDPDFVYGVNLSASWRQFDFNMFFYGQYGSCAYNSTKEKNHFFSWFSGENNGAGLLDAWRPDNTSSTIPMVSAEDVNNEKRYSDYFIENTSFLKLSTLEIGYRIPEKVLNKLYMKNARLYVSSQNLLTFKTKDFTGPDPETPSYNYPVPRTITFGINVSF